MQETVQRKNNRIVAFKQALRMKTLGACLSFKAVAGEFADCIDR